MGVEEAKSEIVEWYQRGPQIDQVLRWEDGASQSDWPSNLERTFSGGPDSTSRTTVLYILLFLLLSSGELEININYDGPNSNKSENKKIYLFD